AAVARVEADGQEDVGRALAGGDARFLDDLRQSRQRQVYSVLHQHLRHVQIDAVLEGDGQVVRAVVGTLAGHVHHALDAVDLLLDGGGDGLGDDLGAGAGVDAIDLDDGRADRRVQRQRQVDEGDAAGEGDEDR